MRFIGLGILLLLGFGVVIVAVVMLSAGITSMFSDGYIHLIFSTKDFVHWPLSTLGVIFFLMKVIFIFSFGVGLIAFGLFYGLRSDIMYLPAITGLTVGLIGSIMTSLLVKIFLL